LLLYHLQETLILIGEKSWPRPVGRGHAISRQCFVDNSGKQVSKIRL
jgi:hypothetical protein